VTAFIGVCALLLVLLVAVLYWPSRRSADLAQDLRRENLEWYRLRRAELEADDSDLAADAELRLLEDERQGSAGPPLRGGRFPRLLLIPLLALGAVLLYRHLGGVPDVLIARDLQRLGEDSSPEAVAALIERVEQRARQRPGNPDYLAILARHAMGREDFDRARELYDQLLSLQPEDPALLALAAQAEFLAAGRTLTPRAGERARQAVALKPGQRTALGLLGMAAFEQGDYAAAVGYWQRLLDRAGPDSPDARMLASVIAMARERMGGSAPAQAPQQSEPALGVTVRVALPEGMTPDPAATVFVFARTSGGDSRMPLAVRRLSADRLPLTLRLTDADSMAGARLSGAERVDVSVQVSPSGRPGEAYAAYSGTAEGVRPSAGNDVVAIEIRPTEG